MSMLDTVLVSASLLASIWWIWRMIRHRGRIDCCGGCGVKSSGCKTCAFKDEMSRKAAARRNPAQL